MKDTVPDVTERARERAGEHIWRPKPRPRHCKRDIAWEREEACSESFDGRQRIQTEALTEEPAYARLQWAARTQEKRVGRLMAQCLADAVNAMKQSPGSHWEWLAHCKLRAAPQILLRTPTEE